MKQLLSQDLPQSRYFALSIFLLLGLLVSLPTASASVQANLSDTLIDLAIERSPISIIQTSGNPVEWILTITNVRSIETGIPDVLVRELLTPNLSNIEATSSQGQCLNVSAIMIECALGLILPSESATISMRATIQDSIDPRQFTTTAYVLTQSGQVDASLSNNMAIGTINVIENRDVSELLVSPLCVFTGANLLVTGAGLSGIGQEEFDVQVGGIDASSVLLGDSSLSVSVPEIPVGTAEIHINGDRLNNTVLINPACATRAISASDVQSGMVPGELLLFFKDGIQPQDIEQFKNDYQLESLTEYPLIGFYRGQISSEELATETVPQIGESCSDQRRAQYPKLDIMLLADLSGTMDGITLRNSLREMIEDLDCAIHDQSRVALSTYSNQSEVILPLAEWLDQRTRLIDWVEGPLAIGGLSNLDYALSDSIDYLSAHVRDGHEQTIFVLTRGVSTPQFSDSQQLKNEFSNNNISLAGIAFTNFFFAREMYEPLKSLISDLGRTLHYFDERLPRNLDRIALCSVVQGLYGVQSCGPDPISQIPREVIKLINPTERMMELIAEDFRVDQVCLNTLIEHEQLGDPQTADQTWLNNLGVQYIEDYFPRLGDGITIAIIDTGVDLMVAQLGEIGIDPNLPSGLSFANNPTGPSNGTDVVGHGTKVASVSAATGNNGLNGIGVAPRAKVVPIRVFAQTESGAKGNSLWVAEALASAYLMGADVINMSLGDRSRINLGCKKVSSRDYYERVFANLSKIATEALGGREPIIVAATGNDGRKVRCPACVESLISVGAVRLNDDGQWERSPYSNHGPEIDFSAQGDNILTTLEGGAFGDTGPGTSFSAPQVTGLIALILGENPLLTQEDVFEIIKNCFIEDVQANGWDEETGWGRIVIPAPSDSNTDCRSS